MPLLGWPLLALLGALLVAATCLPLLLSNRLRGGRLGRTVQRLGMLAGVQVVATLLMAAAVNNYGYFYGSWSDLFGSAPATGQQVRHVAGAASPGARKGLLAAVPVPPSHWTPLPWAPAGQESTQGTLRQATITGGRSGLATQVVAYLPPQYVQPAHAHTAFPAVEVITGCPGRVLGLVHDGPCLPASRDPRSPGEPGGSRHGQRQHRPAARHGGRGRAPWPPGRDLPQRRRPLVGRAATARPSPGLGVMGYSTGGFCAVKLAMRHPEIFRAAVSVSGYYHTLLDATTGSLYGGSTIYQDLNDPEWLLRQCPLRRSRFWRPSVRPSVVRPA